MRNLKIKKYPEAILNFERIDMIVEKKKAEVLIATCARVSNNIYQSSFGKFCFKVIYYRLRGDLNFWFDNFKFRREDFIFSQNFIKSFYHLQSSNQHSLTQFYKSVSFFNKFSIYQNCFCD